MDNNYLQHYGVLGMKWGIRRAESQLAKTSKRVDKLKAKKKEIDRLNRAKKKLAKARDDEQTLKKYVKNKGKKETTSTENKTDTVDKQQPVKRGESYIKKLLKDAGQKFIVDNAMDVGKQVVKHYMVKFANQKIGEYKRVKNEETNKWEDILQDVVYTNNKKK